MRIRGTTAGVEQAARGMRCGATPAEEVLWRAIGNECVAGLRFRRQHPVDRFVLDFCCPSLKLAVEVDGAVHDAQQEYDRERTAVLERYGYRAIRFRNKEVLEDIAIRRALNRGGRVGAPA